MKATLQYFHGLEIKGADVSPVGEFVGYGSTFGGPPDSYGDVIERGAFARSLAEHKAADTAPALLWSHDPAQPIGRWTSTREDDRGLLMKGRLTLGTARGQEAYALLKDGALALSIGFQLKNAKHLPSGQRLITDVDLLETSLVALPANPAARIVSVKDSIHGPTDLETALRSLGFSAREAKRITAGGWRAYKRDSEELTLAAARLSQHAASLTRITP